MFSFGKKKDKDKLETKEEKEKRKREKKEKKVDPATSSRLTADDLLRLDDIRRSLKIGKPEKLPSGIVADYRDASFSQSGGADHSDTGSTSTIDSRSKDGSQGNLGPPPLPPNRPNSLLHALRHPPPFLPPKKGILKGHRYDVTRSVSSDLDDVTVVLQNTVDNEYTNVYRRSAISPPGGARASISSSTDSPETADREIPFVVAHATTKVRPHSDHVSPVSPPPPVGPKNVKLSTSPIKRASGASSVTSTPSSASTTTLDDSAWRSMVSGENLGVNHRPLSTHFPLQLPDLISTTFTSQKTKEDESDSEVKCDVLVRHVTVTRKSSDDHMFGLLIRRSTKNGNPILVVESATLGVDPVFVSGDQLIAIDDVYVEDKDREEVVKILTESDKDVVTVQVRGSSECLELAKRLLAKKEEASNPVNLIRRSASRHFKADKAKTEEQVASEQAFLDAERVWLVHKEGFAAAGQLRDDENPAPEGRVRVQLDYNGDIIEVDEDDVEKANPPNFDTVEDLAQLRFLNESSVLHTLRQRYGNNLIHTYAGPTIITVNPMSPLSIYSDKVIHMFKECKLEDMPPHIYAVANTAHRTMLRTRKDQSVVFIGRSGSGKTTNLKHTLTCLAATAAASRPNSKKPVTSPMTSEKVNAMFVLLEAFGNSRTVMNANATRFTQLVSVDFDTSGQIVSTSIQALMLEKTRVVRRPEGEPNFNIFYQMLSGLDPKTRRELNLESLSDPNLFMTPLQRIEDKAKASAAWTRISNAAKNLGITPQEAHCLWSVLAAIYHLGVASVSRGNMGKTQFARPQAAQRAAQCLGTTVEELSRAIFQGNTSTTTLNRKLRSSDRESANLPDGIESLEGFVISLYQEVFSAVIYLINRSISTTSSNVNNSILVLDTPGFQNPATCGRLAGATFEEMCHNYVQERLQLMFHDRTITSLHEKYLQEQIDCDMGDLEELTTPAPLISLIDKQAGIRYSQSDLSSADRRGLLWLLDEEAIFPGATDESFVERLLLQYSQRGSQELLKKGPGEKQFLLQHFQGTNPVLYNAEGWLQASREDGAMKAAAFLLQESSHKHLSDLFYTCRGPVSVSVSGSVAGMEGSHALRRASSIRRAFTSSGHAGIKRNSVALQVKFQVDGLCEQLRRSRIHFVHCFLPQHNAGLCDVKGGAIVRKQAQSSDEILMNVPLVRSQLRGAQILDAVRLHKNGFPESLTYGDFWRRYRILSDPAESGSKLQPGLNELRPAVENLLQYLDLDKTAVRLGNTQVFLRSGVLAHLDEEREDKLTNQVVQLQALCRGYLARKQAQKLKVQDIAIRCIQKNVRKFMGVRGWPWWRLLIKLTPMLNVHRTEDQLKSRTDELESLRARFEKMEKERAELKVANERLESRLSEMTADLAEEHSTATLATERLEAEQSERMRLEKEKGELEQRNKQLHSTAERMEMELLYSRALDMNGGVDYSDEDGENSIYKQKYERAMKELEFTKRRLQQQHEDDMEQLVGLKKQLEKKLNDAYEEVDEQRQVVAQWKRKTQKLQGEMHDQKLLLEEQTSRNVLLEKRQRKFDAELGLLQEDRKAEAAAREKLQKEIDSLKSTKYQLDEQITSLKLDLDFKDEKISSLNKELEDLHTGGASEEEVATLKRQKHELEMRLKEEEEEIDDLAGQVQLLEQSKIKLEMSMAAMKKEHRRDIALKEEELEDARAATQKKVKALEQQLENEHEERINFVREKHELETKIINLQEMASRSADEEQVSKLKKDLKRTKALLKDAQLMIERSKSDSSNKVVMRQLKNQLEDSEFAKTAAIKAKQNLELELSDVQQQLDDVLRSKSDLEDKVLRLSREKADLSGQLDDSEEELQEVMKKYKASVSQLSVDQITIHEQANRIADIEEERNKLKEQIAELTSRIESLEGENIVNAHQNRLELKIKELESKLELEQTTRSRMETQINRLKEGIEKINSECDMLRNKELASQDMARKLQRQLRDLREDYATAQQKETEVNSKKNELEKQLELAEAETVLAKNDLKLAMKRIEDLQTAINVELDSESDSLNSDADSDSSEEGMEDFLEHHRRAVSVQRERESVAREAEARASIQREVRASIARESVARTLETMSEEPEFKLSEGSSYVFDESAELNLSKTNETSEFDGESTA